MEKSGEMERNQMIEEEPKSVQELSSKFEKAKSENARWFAIDVLKTFMMVLVIMDHSFTHTFLHNYASPFWERIAIPVLIIIMGYNTVISFNKRNLKTLKELYSKQYFIGKMKRFVMPYLVLFAIQTVIFFIYQDLGIVTIDNFPYDAPENFYLGYTPFWGPGMWFIPVIFQSILILPLLYYFFKKYPILTIVGCFVIEIGFQLLAYFLYRNVTFLYQGLGWSYQFTNWYFTKNYLQSSLLFMMTGLALGVWIAKYPKISLYKHTWIWIILPFSIFYLYLYSFIAGYKQTFYLTWLSGDYNFLAFPWSAFIILLAINILPITLNGKVGKFFKLLSNSTYHILLAEMLYFSFIYHNVFFVYQGFDAHPITYLWYYPLNLLITFTAGVLWYLGEKKFYKATKTKKAVKIVYNIGLWIAIAYFILWIILGILLWILYPISNVPSVIYYQSSLF